MEESAEYYKSIAEVREYTIDTILKPTFDLLTVTGVTISMIADINAYGLKQGKNERYNQSMQRINVISEFIANANSVNDHNYRLRLQLKRSIHERDRLEQENALMKQELDAIKLAFDAE